jgi:putative salt-induced outer membrane protein
MSWSGRCPQIRLRNDRRVLAAGSAAEEDAIVNWGHRATTTAVIAFMTFCSALEPSAAMAQEPKPQEPPPRLESSAQAALLATTGNASAQALGFGGEFTWRPMPWKLGAKAAFTQTETDGELSARSTLAAIRGDRFLSLRTSFFGQYDFLRDLFAGVEQRSTVAGGLAYRLVLGPPHHLTIDGGLCFQHESRVQAEAENGAIATGGAAYRWEISKTSLLAEELRYVQVLDSGDNWKLDQSIALTAAITSVFSLKFANVVRYAHEPVPGFESTDTVTSVALVWTIKRPGP